MENISSLLSRKKSTFLLIVFLFLAIATMVVFAQKLNYSTKSRLIVMSAQTSADPYAASRFNEYIGELLSKTIVSGKFFEEVMNSGYTIDKNYFTSDPNEQNKLWAKTVSVEPLYSVGIIDIEVFHPDVLQSRQIAIAINNILKTKSVDHYSGGNNIKIEIINEPLTSKWIVKPNIPLNVAIGLIFGIVFAISYIYLFPEEEYDLRLWPKRNKSAQKPNFLVQEVSKQAVVPANIQETKKIEDQISSVIVGGSSQTQQSLGGFKGEGDMKNVF